MFDDRFANTSLGFEFAADVSRRMRPVAVNVDFVDAALHVAEQSQFLARPFIQRYHWKFVVENRSFNRKIQKFRRKIECCMIFIRFTEVTVFARVSSAGTVADDASLVDHAQSAVLARVRTVARVDQLAIVQRYFAHIGRVQVARVELLAVNDQVPDAADET